MAPAQHLLRYAELPDIVIQQEDTRVFQAEATGGPPVLHQGVAVGGRQGNQHGETTSPAWRALHIDFSSHLRYEPRSDGETEPEAGRVPAVFQPFERIEYPGSVLHIHTYARVLYEKAELAFPIFRLQADASFFRELDGVREQVVHHLLEEPLLASDHHVQSGEAGGEAEMFLLGGRGVAVSPSRVPR